MTNKTYLIALVSLIAGVGAGYLLWGNANTISFPTTHMMSNGTVMIQGIDRHFIEEMIPHHEGAIAMAKIALTRSKRQEIRTLANDIIEAQEKESADMKSWYQSWFGSAVPETSGSMSMMHMGSVAGDTEILESIAAADFDREFLKEMIPHHEMAVMMGEMLQAATERAEMKQLADNIIASQSREIQIMRGWLASWAE